MEIVSELSGSIVCVTLPLIKCLRKMSFCAEFFTAFSSSLTFSHQTGEQYHVFERAQFPIKKTLLKVAFFICLGADATFLEWVQKFFNSETT